MEPVITAGLDGSSESLTAARWAAGEARLRKRPLRLTHAWVLLAPPGPEGTPDSDQNYWSRRIVDDAETVVHEEFPELPVIKDLVADDPGEALVAAAAQSEMLVLGSRGLAPHTNYFLGDTGLHVMLHAERPVVMVRAHSGPSGAGSGDVVLALNLHGSCDELIEFAFDTSARHGVTLRALHGLHRHPHIHAPWGRSAESEHDLADEKLHQLRDVLRPWREKYPSVPVKESVREEGAAHAVMAAAVSSGLLVVGRRRHHRRLGPHIGPVLQAAVHHAACPVAVVPHD